MVDAQNKKLREINNVLMQREEELSKINRSYEKFIPKQFLRYLNKESIAKVNYGDQIQKKMTVLFADIRGYTTLSESMTPKDNIDFLNAYFRRLGPIITKNNGFVNQYYGDGLMALFGEESMDGINASIEMQKTLTDYNEERRRKNREPILTGIGIHTGKLMLGMIGDGERMDGGVVSDAVNTAARMEGLTKEYGASIVVSGETLEEIKGNKDIKYRFLDTIQVKGKILPISVYEIIYNLQDEINTKKIELQTEYQIGWEAFRDGKIDEAVVKFKKLVKLNPKDKVYQVQLERCRDFL